MSGSGLLPYVPRLVATWPPDAALPGHTQIPGTMLFADISGFTKLSEKLAGLGKQGAEELLRVINSTFESLLAEAYEEDGELFKFGGDAMLLLFRGDGHALRGVRAAARMRKRLRTAGPIQTDKGMVRLKISIGAHTGDFDFYLVGTSHTDLLVSGPAASRTVEMEQAAEGGDVLVSPQTAELLPKANVGEAKGPGFLLRGALKGEGDLVPQPVAPLRDDISDFIPLAIRDYLAAGGEGPSHRLVTILFLHYDGVNELSNTGGPEAVIESLHELVTIVQRAAEDHQLTYIDSDIDLGGGKIYLAAGAPAIRQDDEGRMLLAARQILNSAPPLPVKIGVNNGHVFVGDIGPPYRRTYTFMGDEVNLAARVMSKASDGQVLATESVLEQSLLRFEVDELEPFTVKGKSKPVTASVVGRKISAKVGRRVRTRLIGRDEEIEQLRSAVASVRGGEGSVIEIVGDSGIGKTRLVEEFLKGCTGVPAFKSASQVYDISTPYGPFKQLLSEVAEIDPAQPEETKQGHLERLVSEVSPGQLPWLPLIGVAMGINFPPTAETAALDEQFIPATLERAVTELLSDMLTEPTIFVFEDAHWMDNNSSYLLRALGRTAADRPWVICVTRHDVEEGFSRRSLVVTQLRPDPLSQDEIRQMIEEATSDAPLRPYDVRAISERAAGNPLFAEELLGGLQGGFGELPDSLERAIGISIDRLPPQDRVALRRLSVLGSAFGREQSGWVLAEPLEDSTLDRLTDYLDAAEDEIRFRNSVMRDAAYEGLPYSLRQELHGHVADNIEMGLQESSDEAAAVLSFHNFEAKRFGPAWRYARRGGEVAKKVYANAEAVTLFERALAAASKLDNVPSGEVVHVWRQLAERRIRMGEYDRAAVAIRSGRELTKQDPVADADLIRLQVQIPFRTGKLSNAVRWLNRGLKSLEGVEGSEAGTGRAGILAWLGAIRHSQGRSREAIKICTQAMTEARKWDARKELAHASSVIDVARMATGEPTDLSDTHNALALYEELEESERKATVLNNLGGFAYYRGDWDGAVSYYAKAKTERLRSGAISQAALTTYNIAEILTDQGKFEDAEAHIGEVMRETAASGNVMVGAMAKTLQARVLSGREAFEEGLALIDKAAEALASAGAKSEVAHAGGIRAGILALSGRLEDAIDATERVVEVAATNPGAKVSLPRAYRVRGVALAGLGRKEDAEAALQESLRSAERVGSTYDEALAKRALGQLIGDDAMAADADATLTRLGVSEGSALTDPLIGPYQ